MDAEVDSPRLPYVLRGTLFIIIELQPDSKVIAKCRKCNENDVHAFVRGTTTSTGNFLRHYKRHHKEAYNEIVKKSTIISKKRKIANNEDEPISDTELNVSKRCKISNLPDEEKQKMFDYKLIKFIIEGMKAYSTVDDPTFHDMIEVLDSEIDIMSRRTLGRKLDEIYLHVVNKIKESLKSIQYLSSTTDIWSTRQRSFLGVTIHYINDSFERCSAVLACRRFKGRHTYDQIGLKLDSIYREFELNNSQIVSTITDNAKNFVKAFQEYGTTDNDNNCLSEDENFDEFSNLQCFDVSNFSSDSDNESNKNGSNDIAEHSYGSDDSSVEGKAEFEPIEKGITYNPIAMDSSNGCEITLSKHLRCASHTLNLLYSTDFKNFIVNSEYREYHEEVMQKCQAIWSALKRPMSAEKLKDILGCSLKYPTDVRWNTFQDSLGDLIKNKDKLNDLLKELKKDFIFTSDDLHYIEELHSIMKPIAVALDRLQADNCYYGTLLPELYSLRTTLKNIPLEDLSYLNEMVPYLVNSLENRFSILFSISDENREALAATVLCPWYKLNWPPKYFNELQMTEIKKIVIQACQECLTRNEEDSSENASVKENVTARQRFITLIEDPPSSNSFEAELDQFLSLENKSISLLNYYPRIRKCFMRYNTSLCSSAPVERLFSRGGFILNSRRCNLSDHKFEIACTLKANCQYF